MPQGQKRVHSWRKCTAPVCKICMGKHHALVCLVLKGEQKVLSIEQNYQDDDNYDDQEEDHTTENPDEDEDDYDDQIQEEQDSLEVMCLTTAFGPESVETKCPNEDSESDDDQSAKTQAVLPKPKIKQLSTQPSTAPTKVTKA